MQITGSNIIQDDVTKSISNQPSNFFGLRIEEFSDYQWNELLRRDILHRKTSDYRDSTIITCEMTDPSKLHCRKPIFKTTSSCLLTARMNLIQTIPDVAMIFTEFGIKMNNAGKFSSAGRSAFIPNFSAINLMHNMGPLGWAFKSQLSNADSGTYAKVTQASLTTCDRKSLIPCSSAMLTYCSIFCHSLVSAPPATTTPRSLLSCNRRKGCAFSVSGSEKSDYRFDSFFPVLILQRQPLGELVQLTFHLVSGR